MATDIVMRTGLDRLRYAVLFEGILVVALSFTMVLMFDRSLLDMGALSVVLSLIALIINFIYNYAYDTVDVRHGRVPTERSRGGRIVHAVGFEFTLVLVNLPVIMWWMQWGWWQAVVFDVVAMAAVVVYTYFFTLAYDRVFPIAQPGATTGAAPWPLP
jgi:uncharacterized membrane protein